MKKIVDIKAYQKWFAATWGEVGSVQASIVGWLNEQPDYKETQQDEAESVKAKTAQKKSLHGAWFDHFKARYEVFCQAQKIVPQWTKGDNQNLDDIINQFLAKTEGDYQRALDGWVMVLDFWDNLNAFIRDQTRLHAINKNLEEIIRKMSRYVKESNSKGLGKWA